MTQSEIIRNNLTKSDWEITKEKCDSTRAHRRHLAANGKHENKRKIYCTNVHLRIIEILITLMYKLSAVTAAVTGGVVAADVGDAIRIDDVRGIKIPYYDGNPSNLDDFILDWEDFPEQVVGEMKGALRDKWVCRTFPHRLAQDLKEELRDQIREGLIGTEQACL